MNWRPIPGFPGYYASACGKIRGKRSEVLVPWEGHSRGSPRTYEKVGLWRDGKRVRIAVHRLVALAHHGRPRRANMDVAHVNHCTTDNRASNLRWQTKRQNIRDTFGEDALERRAIFEETVGVLVYSGPSDGAPF